MTRGWRNESHRHSLSAKGIKTSRKNKFVCRGVDSLRARVVPVDDLFDMLEWRDSYRNLYPNYKDDEDVNVYSNEYYFESKEQAEEFAEDVYDFFDGLPNPIPLFRTIESKGGIDVLEEPYGEHWSVYKDSAIDFGKRNFGTENLYLLKGFVKPSNIDWWNTVGNYVRFSLSMTDEDEFEVFVPYDGKMVFDTKIKKVV